MSDVSLSVSLKEESLISRSILNVPVNLAFSSVLTKTIKNKNTNTFKYKMCQGHRTKIKELHSRPRNKETATKQ